MTAFKAKPSRVGDQASAEAAVNRAASIQRQLDRQELHCSLIALAAKAAIFLVGCVSVARLSVAYQERLDRHGEIAAVVNLESKKLETLQYRFDRLFSIGGEKRLLSEQDQWIAPNRLRVIWR
uniref:Cell division protein FtsL n=1 Tax=uncultured marine type-A Synechococcus GOM 5D20 TaxID=364154 RepID=Q0QK57_9SYNE|nr:unknown [uncultured marine type-A Synechococcus GOM 5D20]